MQVDKDDIEEDNVKVDSIYHLLLEWAILLVFNLACKIFNGSIFKYQVI